MINNRDKADRIIKGRVSSDHLAKGIKGVQAMYGHSVTSYSDSLYWILKAFDELCQKLKLTPDLDSIDSIAELAALSLRPQQERSGQMDRNANKKVEDHLTIQQAILKGEQLADTDDDPFKEWNEAKRKGKG